MNKAAFFFFGLCLISFFAGDVYAGQNKSASEDASPSEALFFYTARGHGDLKVVTGFIEGGADVHYRDANSGRTSLHNLATYKHAAAVSVLLEHGADPNVADQDQRTPLHDAVSYMSVEICRLLIAKGADVNRKNLAGKTPFFSVVYWDAKKAAIELVTLFFKSGYDPGLADENFLNEAIRRGRKEVALMLLEQGLPFDDASLLFAAREGYHDLFTILLDRGANPNQNSMFENVCASGDMNITRILVTRGIKPSAEAVDLCLFNGHKEAAVYLNQVLKKETGQEVDIKRRCHLEPDGGMCKALFWSAYFDPGAKVCREFAYGGCGGQNPFESLEACQSVCEE
ncbi:ankyrin repeat domain-containing protein [Desulfuromonas sp. CSMB_57]|uniref:ankyrin repeat domain-containing protein n=1 Tax=Desulfuromonas sp. CSMB_57 TaxID=2807629 RepID=UPI001CD4BD62|nr:ankyrin repeat domain-containing protein [Desulfuromonas sp. CSMB_57]